MDVCGGFRAEGVFVPEDKRTQRIAVNNQILKTRQGKRSIQQHKAEKEEVKDELKNIWQRKRQLLHLYGHKHDFKLMLMLLCNYCICMRLVD